MARFLMIAGLLMCLLGVGSYLAAGPLSQGAQDALGFEAGFGSVAESACRERYRVLGLELALLGALVLGCGLLARAARARRSSRELKRVGTWYGFAAVILLASAAYFVLFADNFRDSDVIERTGGRGLQMEEIEEFFAYRSESHRSRGWILAAGGALLLPLGLMGILAAAGSRRGGRLLVALASLALLVAARSVYGEPATAQELNDFLVNGRTITQYRGLLVAGAGGLLAVLAIVSGVLLAPPTKT